MSEKPRRSVPDPIFNDFLYTILYNSSYAQKRELHGRYLKAAMSEKSARLFIQNASDEDKKYILGKLGYKFFWCFCKEDFKQEYLSDILKKFQEDRKVSALKDILETGIFVTGDREFLRLMGLMSSAIHQPSFYFDLEMQRQGLNIKKWKKRYMTPIDLKMRDLDEGSTELARTLLSASVSMDYVKGTMGLSAAQMKILLYLYTQPHIFMSEKHLKQFFTGYVRGAELRTGVRNLFKEGFVTGEKKLMEWSYTISSKGTKTVSEYFKLVFTKMTF